MRRAFTLIELVVVILIIGLLASIAAGRFRGVSQVSTENSLRANLREVRNAIDRFTATHSGSLPGEAGTEADFKADLAPYLRRFPPNPLKGGDQVDVQTTGDPLSRIPGSAAWRYDNRSGQFIANSNGTTLDGTQRYDEL